MTTMSDKPKFTQKQKAFVKEVTVNQTNPTQAVINAGYKPGSRNNASNMASQLMAQPKIKNALAEALDKKYPNIAGKSVDIIWQCLNDPDAKYETKLKMLEFLAKVKGWLAPTKHANLNVSWQEKFKLPEE